MVLTSVNYIVRTIGNILSDFELNRIGRRFIEVAQRLNRSTCLVSNIYRRLNSICVNILCTILEETYHNVIRSIAISIGTVFVTTDIVLREGYIVRVLNLEGSGLDNLRCTALVNGVGYSVSTLCGCISN